MPRSFLYETVLTFLVSLSFPFNARATALSMMDCILVEFPPARSAISISAAS